MNCPIWNYVFMRSGSTSHVQGEGSRITTPYMINYIPVRWRVRSLIQCTLKPLGGDIALKRTRFDTECDAMCRQWANINT